MGSERLGVAPSSSRLNVRQVRLAGCLRGAASQLGLSRPPAAISWKWVQRTSGIALFRAPASPAQLRFLGGGSEGGRSPPPRLKWPGSGGGRSRGRAAEEGVVIPEGLWIKCESCKEIIYRAEVERTGRVCPKCRYPFRIGARERITSLLDEGSFEERDDGLRRRIRWASRTRALHGRG